MKKIFAFILFSACTLCAWAQTVVTTEDELVAAVLTDGANIQFGNDITVGKHVTIATNVTIDLNGYTMRGNDAALPTAGDFKCLFITAPEGNLTLRNGTLADSDNRGAERHNSSIGRAHSAGAIVNKGTATLENITITNCHGIEGGAIRNSGTLRMKGANIITDNTTVGGSYSNIYLLSGTVLHITGSLAGSQLVISMETNGVFTSGYSSFNSGVDPATIFQPEWPDVTAVTLDNNEAKLGSSLAEGDYYYIDNHWSDGKLTYETKILHPGEYKLITPAYYEDTDLNMSGTYVVTTNNKGYKCHYDGIAYVTANTKIILCDGAKLEINGCLFVAENEVILDVYGQVNNTGVLQAHGDITHYGENYPGIGSGQDKVTDMHFHGGHIIAKGENSYAGIGAGHSGHNHSKIYFYNANVEATGGSGGAGIGTWIDAKDDDDDDLNIYIYGGTIKAWGGSGFGDKYAAGIGGGYDAPGINLFVYGGEVYAYGAANAAGIGGGWDGDGGWTEVRGGMVKAYGGENGAGIGSGSNEWVIDNIPPSASMLKIFGGEVYAYGGVDAAGVGGGEDCDGGTLEVYGGYLYAEGNDNGAGIGGGEDGKGTWVTIYGGTVVAKTTGTDEGSRAIGPGDGNDDYRSLDIGYDMMVTSERKFTAAERKNACWYRTNVRVEVCDHSDGFTYTIDGTGINDHHISHCPYCLHTDTALHTFDEHGVCTVCGVHTTAYAAKLYMPVAQPDGSFDGQTYNVTATHLVVPDSIFRLPMATLKVPGLTFVGWEATTEPTGESYQSPYTNYQLADTLYRVGNKYTVSGNISFVARYKVSDIYLYDDESNGETLNEYNGQKVSKVILSGRVFNKNNTWQPLALPFDLSAEELAASPLVGCTLKELDTDSSYNDAPNHMVYLYFKDTTAIAAGVPYIIRWASGDPVLSPEFENVTLTNKTADAKARLLLYKSIYSPQTFTSANKKVLYFREDGVLLFPDGQAPVTVGSCRAYFRLTNFQADEDPEAEWTISSNLDGEGLNQITNDQSPMTHKVIYNGLLFIERNGRIYNAQGAAVK